MSYFDKAIEIAEEAERGREPVSRALTQLLRRRRSIISELDDKDEASPLTAPQAVLRYIAMESEIVAAPAPEAIVESREGEAAGTHELF